MRAKRKLRVRAKITGSGQRPRLCVFRSNRTLYAQLIDDTKGITLASTKVAGKTAKAAQELGSTIAAKAKEKKITTAVFDRAAYRYHGVIKTLVDAAREAGLVI